LQYALFVPTAFTCTWPRTLGGSCARRLLKVTRYWPTPVLTTFIAPAGFHEPREEGL
jgi:hypothetical protein